MEESPHLLQHSTDTLPITADKPWFLYLLECHNNAIYTGITVNIEKRYTQHTEGKGARYTRANPPKKILEVFTFSSHSLALKAEYAVM